MKYGPFCIGFILVSIGGWGQSDFRLSGLLSIPFGIDSAVVTLLPADDGPVTGLGRQGVCILAQIKQPYGLGPLRNQRLGVRVMKGRQAVAVSLSQSGKYPLQSMGLTLDYARVLSPQVELGIRNGMKVVSQVGIGKRAFEAALQLRWQPQRFFWMAWQLQRNWQQSESLASWDLSATLGFAWPAKAASALQFSSYGGQAIRMEWRGQVYLQARAGLYAECRPFEQVFGLGWWLAWTSCQLLLSGQYHTTLGVSPQVGIQFHFKKERR